MAQKRSGGETDWKDKYLTALEDQEKRERAQQELASLLMRAVTRIALIADGVDSTLDKQLAGLRQMLRDGNPSRRDLNTVVDALEGQVKRLDDVRSERTRTIQQSFKSLISQLNQLRPEKASRQQLNQLDKSLGRRAGKVEEYASLVKEFSRVQKGLLEDAGGLRISKPFWHRWAPESESEVVAPPEEPPSDRPADREDAAPAEQEAQGIAPHELSESDGLDLASELIAEPDAIDPASVGKEPPFSKLNQAVCAILTELLDQIEVPPMAKENYEGAHKQLARGLNWYELVPVLEDVSIVVMSAFDNNQKEFEKFLSRLNGRLSEAYQFISASRSVHEDGAEANRELKDSMQAQVSAMQQSVVAATSLDHLKSEVNQRLEQIVAAMDDHSRGEQAREASLSEQLDSLVERVKNMEAASADVEQRIEEQRQKALRDVLTQLPNREAYQQRLEQEFDRWQRYHRPLTMVVCDVDHFKKINDSYGHLAGDKVLRIIARTLKKRLRKTDFIARYGGEEFVILMPETPEEAALKVCEGVRQAIANCPFHFKEQPVKITTSFGVSGFYEGDLADAVFARADKALYEAKNRGRDRCVAAPVPEPPVA